MLLNISSNQNVFITSDTHFNHANICSATSTWINPTTLRKFDSLEQMNSSLVNKINAVVREDDILFHLGDWSFGGFESVSKFRNRLVCKNIHLLLGNHDHHIKNNHENCRDLFSSVNDYLDITIKYNSNGSENRFIFIHYPIASWNDMARNSIHLHGHVHFDQQNKFGPGKMLDVGCDGNNLEPYNLKDIINAMKIRPVKSLFHNDHHQTVETYKK